MRMILCKHRKGIFYGLDSYEFFAWGKGLLMP